MSANPTTTAGAGLGGLTPAHLLHVHGTAAAVHDLDAPAVARPRGGVVLAPGGGGPLAHEAAVLPHAEAAADQSAASLGLCLRDDAPRGLVDPFASSEQDR